MPHRFLLGLLALLALQAAGELLARGLGLPLPGPVLGLLLLTQALRWAPLRSAVAAGAEPLLAHLSLLFVPVAVGVLGHGAVLGRYGLQLLLVLLISTALGLLASAWVLRGLRTDAEDVGP